MTRRPNNPRQSIEQLEPRRLLNGYTTVKLVSDGFDVSASHNDIRLTNPWGLAVGSHGIEVSDEARGVGTMYDGTGQNVVGTVRVPGPNGSTGGPTGVVFNNDSTKFTITGGSESAQFIFVTVNGTIDGWSGLRADTAATVVADNSPSHAIYTGAAIANFKRSPELFVANFNGGVEAFDSSFHHVATSGKFRDSNLPAHYQPFNVTNVGNQLFVTYAEHDPGQPKETQGAGLGLVDVFGTDGKLIRRFTTGGKLNAPWGVALAPSSFGDFSGDLLVGNLGDGKITAFTPSTGARKGQLSDINGTPIALDGLWGIAFGNGRNGNLTNGLYFAAGSNHETDGLYGRLIVNTDYVPPSAGVFHPGTNAMNDPLDNLFG